jgi:hypothetical protein
MVNQLHLFSVLSLIARTSVVQPWLTSNQPLIPCFYLVATTAIAIMMLGPTCKGEVLE